MELILIHWTITIYAFWQAWYACQRMRTELLRGIIFGGLGLIHGLVPAIGDPYHQRTPDPYNVHVEAALYVLIGTLLLGIGWRFGSRMIRTIPGNEVFDVVTSSRYRNRLILLFFLCAALGVSAWVMSIYASGVTVIQAFTAKRLEFRGEGSGILGALCTHLMATAFVPGFLGFFLKGRFRTLGIAYAIIFAITLYLGSRGTRAPAIGMFGSVIGGAILAHRISAERLIAAIAGISLVAVLTVALYPLRHQMSQMSFGEMVGFLASEDAYVGALRKDPLNYHDHFVGVVGSFPSLAPYVDAASYRRTLFFYLPSQHFPDLKPPDPNRLVAEVLFGANDLDHMHPPSIYGDCYINFWGWRGIWFLLAEGALIAWVSRRVVRDPWWFLIIGPQLIYFSLIGLRGQPYEIATYGLSSLMMMFALLHLTGVPLTLAGQTRKTVHPHLVSQQPRRIAA